MEDLEFNEGKGREIFSKAVKAGRRTYFFDVKETKSNGKYLTITESKRKFNNETGKFSYEKHKIFLYKDDFEKFTKNLNGIINFVDTGILPEEEMPVYESDIDFDDLGRNF